MGFREENAMENIWI